MTLIHTCSLALNEDPLWSRPKVLSSLSHVRYLIGNVLFRDNGCWECYMIAASAVWAGFGLVGYDGRSGSGPNVCATVVEVQLHHARHFGQLFSRFQGDGLLCFVSISSVTEKWKVQPKVKWICRSEKTIYRLMIKPGEDVGVVVIVVIVGDH